MFRRAWTCVIAACALMLQGCAGQSDIVVESPRYVGTQEAFAADAVYFVVTDRFVDGDANNNFVDQGAPDRRTFDRPVTRPDGGKGNVGYLGGDFRGVLNNAGYIADMGFTAVWITPIVDNPNEAFTGGFTLEQSGFADNGKSGYHGYWGVNFFAEDEHLVSDGLRFADFTRELRDVHGLKTVLDVVCNHGSPSFSMPKDQPMFGEIYARDGTLIADHQNLDPSDLDHANPLHRFFHKEPDIAQLSNVNDLNPEALDYFVDVYLYWLEQGVDAFRIDTIKHMPHAFWKQFSDRIRSVRPDLFMFGESYDFGADVIAQHTFPENGRISVLDFPGKQRMNEVFGRVDSDYAEILDYLHLGDGTYQNPYELMTFYDNHDMPRMQASDEGFIDAHNWLFTSRGIPIIYYGSEIGFRRGLPEHGGNRDFFGQDNVDLAKSHPIQQQLSRIAKARLALPALQRGLQANADFAGDVATFFRVLEDGDRAQTVLVMLNKGNETAEVSIEKFLSYGTWREWLTGDSVTVDENQALIRATVPSHDVRLYVFDAANTNAALARELTKLQVAAERPGR